MSKVRGAKGDLLSALGRYRLIVFDCDGTLADSQQNIVAGVEHVFHSIGLQPPSSDIIRRQVGLPPAAAIIEMLPEGDPALHQRVHDAFLQMRQQKQAAKRPLDPLYPGIREMIDSLCHPEVFLAIATGKSRAGLEELLQGHHLRGCFHILQTGDQARGKPHPEMLLNAITEAGVRAYEAVMIGDTSFDMAMARYAKVAGIGVSWGYHGRDDLAQSGAAAIIDHPHDLLQAIRHLAERKIADWVKGD